MKAPSKKKELNKPQSRQHGDSLTKTVLKIRKRLYQKHSTPCYAAIWSNNLIFNEKCSIVSKFKDFLIFDDSTEFAKRFYSKPESALRLKMVLAYYDTYSKIFPNYLILPENVYLYKNIRKKQKMIDGLNQIKQEEAENREKVKLKNSSSSSHKFGADLMIEQENVVFTNQINQSIQRCKSSSNKDALDNSISISIMYKQFHTDINNDFSVMESLNNETGDDIRYLLGDWRNHFVQAGEDNDTKYGNSNVVTIENDGCGYGYGDGYRSQVKGEGVKTSSGLKNNKVKGMNKQGGKVVMKKGVYNSNGNGNSNNNKDNKNIKMNNNYHRIHTTSGNTAMNIKNNNNNYYYYYPSGNNNTTRPHTNTNNKSHPPGTMRCKDKNIFTKERIPEKPFRKITDNFKINNRMFSPTINNTKTKKLFDWSQRHAKERVKNDIDKGRKTISPPKRNIFSPIVNHRDDGNTLTKSTPRAAKRSCIRKYNTEKYQTICTGRPFKSSINSRVNTQGNSICTIPGSKPVTTGRALIKTFNSFSAIKTAKYMFISPKHTLTPQWGNITLNTTHHRKWQPARWERGKQSNRKQNGDYANKKYCSPALSKTNTKVLSSRVREEYKYGSCTNANITYMNRTNISKHDKTISIHRRPSPVCKPQINKITSHASDKHRKPSSYWKKNIQKPKQLTMVPTGTNAYHHTESKSNLQRALVLSPSHSNTPSTILEYSNRSQQPSIQRIRVNRKLGVKNLTSSSVIQSENKELR